MKPSKFSKKNREYIKWDKNTKQVRIFPKTTHTGVPAPQLQVGSTTLPLSFATESSAMDDATAQGSYANAAAVTHTETEFVLDFFFLMPGHSKARVGARVISTPLHTKRLGAALRENIKQYEDRFGPIKP